MTDPIFNAPDFTAPVVIEPVFIAPVFIAHRGYASAYPENTLIAVDAAQQAGAKFVEVDIQLSSDRVPVLFHDRDLNRLCQQKGAIHDYTFTQLKEFNASDSEKFADKFINNKITSLEIFVDYLKAHPKLKAFIELKRLMIEVFGEEDVINIIIPLFDGMENQVIFISYNQTILKKIHDETEFTTGIVVDKWSELNKKAEWESEWVFCSYEGLPENNDDLNIKSKIAVFEVGNVGLAKHLLAKGIMFLETFRIKEMLNAFAKEPVNE